MISESNKLPVFIVMLLLSYIFLNSLTMVIQTQNKVIVEDIT